MDMSAFAHPQAESGGPVAAISTTDAQVEATHTTLPVTLRLDDDTLSSAPPPYVDLSEAETKDPQRLEIIKQIRKVNHDGSYTVGYEAEDGTFKIESRDVLGNVKGTYGYIDANGDIKRVSYGAGAQQPPRRPDPDEDIVHIPVRANRSQHLPPQHQLLVPTTRRPFNYQPPTQQYTLQHGSTLRPSVIQTIPRKRPNYVPTTSTTTNSTAAAAAAAATTAAATSPMVAAPSTTEMPQTTAAPSTTSTRITTAAVGEVSEQSTASSTHTAATLLHTKPAAGGLLIIRPTPLPYQAAKTAEQLARPELRLESPPKFATHPSKKTVRGNFFRRQLTSPAATTIAAGESGEQYEAQAQQQQQITYGGDGGELYGGGAPRSLYTTHPTTRIPAAVLAARQRAAHLQSVLQAQGERLPTTERVYVRQPPRAQPPTDAPAAHRHEPSRLVAYEPSTESTSENSYVTDSPAHGQSVVQIPGAAASEGPEPEAEERHPILFRPRPIDYRPPGLHRYRTPYGLPPAAPPPSPASFARAFPTGQEPPTDNELGGGRDSGQPPYLSAYRQQRRLLLPQQPPPSQQQQSSYPIPVPYGGRLAPSPYYYDIPAERPLTARDFERILQVLIYRHQQLQQHQAALRYGGYHPGGFQHGGRAGYNPYFLEPSVAPFGLPGGGYPQQQIPRPPLPFPYGAGHLGQYDGYQNLLYSPSTGVRSEGPPDAAGYGSAIRRQGQYYAQQQEPSPSGRAGGDYLPPEVRESLLYRMLMLAMQAPSSSGELLPLAAAAAASLTGGGYPLQGSPSMTTVRAQTPPARELGGSAAAATTMASLYSKKPVRSVQILGEE
ncbi:uncharacterized protein LOC131213321 [Anopheles bellator]|uniref:uncharacterized protein LOC131213321 n=1 Tax=Anopheles bellator TaxID=139047 RepID=UPI002649FBB1|nr:uncharacterized protein LOC131213321 [Anopheles bellator]